MLSYSPAALSKQQLDIHGKTDTQIKLSIHCGMQLASNIKAISILVAKRVVIH